MTQHQTLILGGGYAGLMAAMRLHGRAKKQTHITLIDGRDHLVERIRLHQLATGQTLKQHSYQQFLRKTDIAFVEAWVTQIDPQQKTVTLNDGRTLPYNHLIYALGSTIDTEIIPGISEFTHTVQSEKSSQALHQALQQLPHNGRIAICGGGLTGIEIATEIAEQYPHTAVSLLTRDTFAANFSPKGAAYLRQTCQRLNIDILDQHTITHFSAQQIHLADKAPLTADLIIWAGAFTVSPLARQAGLPTHPNGRVLVDQYLRAQNQPDIYVVGDAAHCTTANQHPTRMSCATAMPLGTYAGQHLAETLQKKEKIKPFRYNYTIWCISLGRRAAIVQTVTPHDTPQARIFSGRFAARIKELICKYTIWSIYLERRFPGSYIWLQ